MLDTVHRGFEYVDGTFGDDDEPIAVLGQLLNGLTLMIVGFVAALVVGIVSLKIVAASVMKKKFSYFAFYCIPVGLLVVVLSLTGARP